MLERVFDRNGNLAITFPYYKYTLYVMHIIGDSGWVGIAAAVIGVLITIRSSKISTPLLVALMSYTAVTYNLLPNDLEKTHTSQLLTRYFPTADLLFGLFKFIGVFALFRKLPQKSILSNATVIVLIFVAFNSSRLFLAFNFHRSSQPDKISFFTKEALKNVSDSSTVIFDKDHEFIYDISAYLQTCEKYRSDLKLILSSSPLSFPKRGISSVEERNSEYHFGGKGKPFGFLREAWEEDTQLFADTQLSAADCDSNLALLFDRFPNLVNFSFPHVQLVHRSYAERLLMATIVRSYHNYGEALLRLSTLCSEEEEAKVKKEKEGESVDIRDGFLKKLYSKCFDVYNATADYVFVLEEEAERATVEAAFRFCREKQTALCSP